MYALLVWLGRLCLSRRLAQPRDGASADTLTTEVVTQLLQELDSSSNKNGQMFLLATSDHLGSTGSSLLSRLERKI